MPDVTDTVVSPSPPGTTTPPGKVCALLFRKRRGEEWRELFSHPDPEEVWRWSLEFRENGLFRYAERPPHLFEQSAEPEPAR